MILWAVVTPPKDEPLTLADARLHLREPEDAENGRIAANLTAARQHVENVCERAIMPQTWRVARDDFRRAPHRIDFNLADFNHLQTGILLRTPLYRHALQLPGGNVRAIVALKYFDLDGVEQTLAPSAYQLDAYSSPARVLPAPGTSWPATQCDRVNAVTIEYTCGWPDAASVPQALKSAILLLLGDLHENREASLVGVTTTPNPAAASLLWPYRLRVLA